MRGVRAALIVVLASVGFVASTRWSLRAQERAAAEPEIARAGLPSSVPNPRKPVAACTVQDALERPFDLPFKTPTRLDEVCRVLQASLGAPVVLDRAALDRREIRPEDSVELELKGVRLKTGLKLLLDQVGLTYRVVTEDNLLIVTDDEGSDNPLDRVFAELRALHRDLHTVQDSVDELRAALGLDDGPKIRKPTIIEDPLETPGEKKAAPLSPPMRPRS
jgi:hypothetical protein